MIEIKIDNGGEKTLEDIHEAFWIIRCAMAAIEESYCRSSQRYREMESHYNSALENLREQLEELDPKPTVHDVCFLNLNHLYSDGEVPQQFEEA